MINHFTFNGTSTAQLGLIVSGVSIFGAGSRKVEKARIPGRNGDLQIELGGFNNYTVRYTVSITNDFTTTAQQIREWLLESKGYCDLTDTYHPDEIRKACFNSDIEFTTSMLYKYGQASIQFDCLPERYLTTNTPITTTATADTTTDTTMSLSTVPTPINISLNGNTTQEGTPTPTNPQVIHNVSGDNEIKVLNKNLLDIQTEYLDYSFKLSGLSLSNIRTDTRTFFQLSILAYNNNTYIRFVGSGAFTTTGEKSVTFNSGDISGETRWLIKHNGSTSDLGIAYVPTARIKANTDYTISFDLVSNNPTTVNGLIISNIQLEVGSTATTYEPYTRQSYPLNLGSIELNKIGTYQDYIYKNGGKWYVHKEIGRYVFIGANEEGWTLTSSYTNNTRYSEAIITARTSGSALSNYFTKGTAGTDTTNIDINGSNGRIMITIPNTIASTVNDLKTWLSTHNTEVYYVLATPTDTEITDTTLINQLNNIEKAYSYNGTTNILQVSNDNGFMLEVVSLHGSTFNSNYKGEPIITVNSTGLIYLNGEVMEVLSAPVTINCQTMQCYNGVVNMNNEVRVNDFPEIKIGENKVGSSMALTITPNNWRH